MPRNNAAAHAARCFALALTLALTTAAQTTSTEGGFANPQGSPLRIISETMNNTDLCAHVSFLNVSNRPILRAKLGWIVADAQNSSHAVPFLGTPFDLNLAPGGIEDVGRQGATVSVVRETLEKLGTTHGTLTVGVVYVKFQDGSEWSYPLAQKRAFGPDAPLPEQFAPAVSQFIEQRAHAAAPPSAH